MEPVESTICDIEGGAVLEGNQRRLDRLDLSLRGGRVTVLLGPGASGKSTFLRALVGMLPRNWRREGSWRWRTREGELRALPAEAIFWMAQKEGESGDSPATHPLRGADLARALSVAPPVVLLDEPRFATADLERSGWVDALFAARTSGSLIVVVTHDVSLAERIGDDILLFYEGRVVARGQAPDFFVSPPNEAARQFIRQGNCCLPREGLPLPSHFRWIVANQLAGMGRPGLVGEVDGDLAAIAGAGVTHLVSLTEEPFPRERLAPHGIELHHFPIPDMGVPALATAARICRDVTRWMRQGSVVAVHCHAGLGRTGLVLATILVWEGLSPQAAIDSLRAERKGYLQNRAQEFFVERFAEAYGQAGRGA